MSEQEAITAAMQQGIRDHAAQSAQIVDNPAPPADGHQQLIIKKVSTSESRQPTIIEPHQKVEQSQ